jgi:hypothetical protein
VGGLLWFGGALQARSAGYWTLGLMYLLLSKTALVAGSACLGAWCSQNLSETIIGLAVGCGLAVLLRLWGVTSAFAAIFVVFWSLVALARWSASALHYRTLTIGMVALLLLSCLFDFSVVAAPLRASSLPTELAGGAYRLAEALNWTLDMAFPGCLLGFFVSRTAEKLRHP